MIEDVFTVEISFVFRVGITQGEEEGVNLACGDFEFSSRFKQAFLAVYRTLDQITTSGPYKGG